MHAHQPTTPLPPAHYVDGLGRTGTEGGKLSRESKEDIRMGRTRCNVFDVPQIQDALDLKRTSYEIGDLPVELLVRWSKQLNAYFKLDRKDEWRFNLRFLADKRNFVGFVLLFGGLCVLRPILRPFFVVLGSLTTSTIHLPVVFVVTMVVFLLKM